ncbi:MAG: nucleotidyltransferase family protein [Bacteroidota bacterium]
MIDKITIGAAVLAAGPSRRLGEPKQLVRFKGKSLLQHTIDLVVEVQIDERMLILGANEQEIRHFINFKSFDVIQNQHWKEGMASSIRLAVEVGLKKELDGLLILLSDQPYIDLELLNNLIGFYKPKKELIMASEYNNVLGVPALFDRHYFRELMELTGDSGAKRLINAYREKVKEVKFEKGLIDIDTPTDLDQLKKH